MSWYAVHTVGYFREPTDGQDKFKVWESILLISAASRDEAATKGEARARQETENNTSVTGLTFVGIRKIVDCFSAESFGNETQPGDGAEITFCQYLIQGASNIEAFARGEEVPVLASEKSEPFDPNS
jgi:hypothetical protein